MVPGGFTRDGELMLIFNVDVTVPKAFQNVTLKTETVGAMREEDQINQ